MIGISYIIFRCLNFLIVIAVGYYYTKKYVVSSLKERMKAEEERRALFDHTYHALQDAHKTLQAQIEEDALVARHLMEKLKLWKQAHQERVLEQENADQLHMRKLEEYGRIRAQKIAQQALVSSVIPQTLSEARATLEKKFSSLQEGRQFLHDVISLLQEEKG